MTRKTSSFKVFVFKSESLFEIWTTTLLNIGKSLSFLFCFFEKDVLLNFQRTWAHDNKFTEFFTLVLKLWLHLLFLWHCRKSQITLFECSPHQLRSKSLLAAQKQKIVLGMRLALHYPTFSENPFSIWKLQSVFFWYFIYSLKGGWKKNTGV